MTTTITVVGGGLAGLTAAIACAEAGVPVRLYEAHATLGGRARATAPPYVAHEGAHVFYADGPHYAWLKRRGFVAGLGLPGPAAMARFGFRADGRVRPMLPMDVLRAQLRPVTAPVDQDFRSWAAGRWGERTATRMANAIAVATYDADTGRLSAAFVWDLVGRVFGPKVPAVRWVRGGWQRVIDRMAARAAELGVVVETGARLDALPSGGPVVVATDLHAARRLLGDDTLAWTSGNAALLDLGVPADRRDRTILFDLDEGGFHESYTMQDPTIAPAGHSLFQLQMPVRAGESPRAAQDRLARFADLAVPGWRDRATFRRTATAKGRTGALDLPGQTWRDRPAVVRGDDVFLAGDMVAAPGMRGEISINSALHAARAAVAACARAARAV
ncbi:NAD(P)-binding protein [Nocardia farcinica]|uniref:NAD(P)-binding protein n=1 Tax=Nocardia farcinica TaxID=37329 RepID=UPI00189420C7|nr:NAD(P)-binding protein [Nocardia farcinica]MBF6071487.1 NAD(P)-binding protein [Nocardia farcinica]MBF6417117.1 NAD(P)-binding protein [Nocardia farcinica]MBF6432218.1 NAD(P)-binding protein [Nocardia farcinica]MBF6502458.1 NAD(P)-binding protein [Nocardia farcinica]